MSEYPQEAEEGRDLYTAQLIALFRMRVENSINPPLPGRPKTRPPSPFTCRACSGPAKESDTLCKACTLLATYIQADPITLL
jgi:hypothetical protein